MYAVEIDQELAELAKPYYEKIIVGDVENDDIMNQIPDIYFDYVLCMNVLEHLKNPKEVLVKLKKNL